MDEPGDYHTKWSQRKTNIVLLICGIKKNATNEQTHWFRQWIYDYWWGGWEWDRLGVWDCHVCTTLFNIDNQ